MRRAFASALLLIAAMAWVLTRAPAAAAQEPQNRVVDRIIARVEDDVILLSDSRELAAYQQLVDGHAEPAKQLVDELIEQWVVNNEATTARFPQPAESEVNREVQRIADTFPNPQAYAARLSDLDLTPESVRRIVSRQIYLARYLDYKFRPAIQVDDDAIARYYNDQLAPALKAKGQSVPPIETVTDQIRNVLTEKGINDRAASWFDDTKSRLKIEIEQDPAASSGSS